MLRRAGREELRGLYSDQPIPLCCRSTSLVILDIRTPSVAALDSADDRFTSSRPFHLLGYHLQRVSIKQIIAPFGAEQVFSPGTAAATPQPHQRSLGPLLLMLGQRACLLS